MSANIAVLGAGNWGATVAQLVATAGHGVRLWTRSPEQRDELNAFHTNRRFTGEARLHPAIVATTDLAEAVTPATVVFVVVPSKGFREVARALGELARPDQVYLHGTKGLELGTHRRMSELLLEETCVRQLGVVSGPNIATELLRGLPAGTVIASKFPRVIQEGTRALASGVLRVFSNDDVTGVELAGAFKNVAAIAAGIADALEAGESAKAMLVTRAIGEMARLGAAMGAEPSTFFGMAGIGDLVVTCASPHSRNHRLGVALAEGATLEQAKARLGMVAEGVNTARTVHELARERGLELPLFEKMHEVLFEGLPPAEAVAQLMRRPPGRDVGRLFG